MGAARSFEVAMRLLDLSYFESIFGPLRGLRIGLVDGFGNVGDHLIYAATRQLLDAFEIDWISQRPGDRDPVDKLLLFGGGNMGSSYVREVAIRRRALKRGVPAIVLPQSFMGPERGTFERVFVRERASLKHCPNADLAPDLALGYHHSATPSRPIRGRGIFLRSDREGRWRLRAILGLLPHEGDPVRRCASYTDYLSLAGQYEHIVTNRLHFAICGLLNRRRVTLLPNSYHKNRGVWESWLAGLGCEWANSPEEVGDARRA